MNSREKENSRVTVKIHHNRPDGCHENRLVEIHLNPFSLHTQIWNEFGGSI